MYQEKGELFSLEGRILLATRSVDGNPENLRYVGTVPNATLEMEIPTYPYYGSDSGYRVKQGQMTGTPTGKLNAVLSRLNKANLADVLHAVVETQATDPVLNEPLPDGLAAGAIVMLQNVGVSALTITDSAETPVTLDPDYYDIDAAAGQINILDITTGGPYTQPFLASYTPSDATILEFNKTDTPEYWLRFRGRNKAKTPHQDVIIDLYRVSIPMALFDALKHEEGTYGNIPFNIEIEADPTKTEDPALGVLGRVRFPTAID
jgi:hypothetical protein